MKSRVDLAKVRTMTRNESLYRVNLARRIRRNILLSLFGKKASLLTDEFMLAKL